MNYIVYGSQSILLKKQIGKLVASIIGEPNDFNVVTFDYENSVFSDIINETTMLGFGCDKKVIIVKNATLFIDSKSNSDNIIKLKEYIEKPSKAISLIFSFIVTPDQMSKEIIKKTDKSLSFVRDNFQIVPIREINENEWISAISKACIKRNYSITPDATKLLIERCNNDLTRVINEIDKLGEYNPKISVNSIEKLVSVPLEDSVFSIAESLVERKIDIALNELHDLYMQKYEATSLIPVIISQLRFMYLVKHLANKNMNDSQISKELAQKSTYRVQIVKRKLINIKESEIIKIIKSLADLDYKIKTGQADRFDSLELLCINLLKEESATNG